MLASNAVEGFSASHLVRGITRGLLGARRFLGARGFLGRREPEFLADLNDGVLCREIIQAGELGKADPILSGNTPERFTIGHGVRRAWGDLRSKGDLRGMIDLPEPIKRLESRLTRTFAWREKNRQKAGSETDRSFKHG